MFICFLVAPYVQEETFCHWEVNLVQTCVVEFSSNPSAWFVSLTKHGKKPTKVRSRGGNSINLMTFFDSERGEEHICPDAYSQICHW